VVLLGIGAGVLRHGPVGRHAGVVAAQTGKGSERVHGLNMGADPGANPCKVG